MNKGKKYSMVKYKYNENWRERDEVYRDFPEALRKTLFFVVSIVEAILCILPKGPGRPQKVTPAKASFL